MGGNLINNDGDPGEGIMIDTGGFVGINTDPPVSELDVTGTSTVTGTLDVTGLVLLDGDVSVANDGDPVANNNLDMGTNRITNVAPPSLGTDAVNRDYVDAAGGVEFYTLTCGWELPPYDLGAGNPPVGPATVGFMRSWRNSFYPL